MATNKERIEALEAGGGGGGGGWRGSMESKLECSDLRKPSVGCRKSCLQILKAPTTTIVHKQKLNHGPKLTTTTIVDKQKLNNGSRNNKLA